jgi:hypothetical protein
MLTKVEVVRAESSSTDTPQFDSTLVWFVQFPCVERGGKYVALMFAVSSHLFDHNVDNIHKNYTR